MKIIIIINSHHALLLLVHFGGGEYMEQGSITGAYSAQTEKVTPSFILLAIQGTKLVCYVYELVNGEVEVSKTEFTKTETATNEGSAGPNPSLMQSLLA